VLCTVQVHGDVDDDLGVDLRRRHGVHVCHVLHRHRQIPVCTHVLIRSSVLPLFFKKIFPKYISPTSGTEIGKTSPHHGSEAGIENIPFQFPELLLRELRARTLNLSQF